MGGVRILIVEDERITAEDLSDILKDLGYEVIGVVASGAEAIGKVEEDAPDLVLMDIRIKGDLDGTQAARILRERFDTPVIYLTAHYDQETLSRAKLAEPLGYIVKPFQESELHATIEMALHKNLADRQRRQNHDRLAAAVEAAGEGVICTDAGGLVTFMNPASEIWTGWRLREAAGRKLDEIVRLVNGPGRVPVPVERVIGEGALAGLPKDSLLVARNGSERPIGGSAAPIRDASGAISGMTLLFGQVHYEPVTQVPDTPAAAAGPEAPAVDIVAESEAMAQLLAFATRVAASEASTVLLEGESGAGKDVLAKFIHRNSRRAAQPFLALNCAAIPETLLESELFGYEKGAFTDARSQKRGILELADGGTAFLDEVGELAHPLQAKLLRVLEEHQFRRLGGTKDIHVDIRVITATNRNLRDTVTAGKFRLDLYYRLNVIQMVVPPLRERPADILPLARTFIAFYNRRFRRNVKGLMPEAARALAAHSWPGNIRELRNCIERAMLMEDGDWLGPDALGIEADTAPALESRAPAAAPGGGLSLAQAEKSMVLQALEKASWNQTKAAHLLKISRDALRYKMKKFNLKPSSAAGEPRP